MTLCIIWKKLSSNRKTVKNIKTKRIRPVNCMYDFGLLSPSDGTPANIDFDSCLHSANNKSNAPTRDKFLNRN